MRPGLVAAGTLTILGRRLGGVQVQVKQGLPAGMALQPRSRVITFTFAFFWTDFGTLTCILRGEG